MKTVKIKDFLIRKKIPVDIKDNGIYKRLTIKTKNQGVFLRDEEIGTNIGTKKQFIACGGQFIVSKIDAMNGAFGIIPIDISEAIITGNFWVYDVDTSLVNVDWFNLFVSLPSFSKICESLSSGTTHRKYLDEKKFSEFQLRLPSMKEQAAAVERFNEQKQITDCVLAEMEKQKKYAEMLRQSILQQAVEGKLCEQDPKDEPASVLLEKINAEKERLIAEKKIKKQKPLPPISDEERPFALPKGWEWCRLPEIGELSRGKSKHRPRNDATLYKDGKYPLVQTGDVARAGTFITTYTALYNDVGLAQSRMWETGTLCITIAANIADTGILSFDACFPDSVVGFQPFVPELDVEFFKWYIDISKKNLEKYAPATAQKNINIDILSGLIVPLPPKNELKKITRKAKNILALYDSLSHELLQSKQYASQLMESVLQEAFSIQETTKPAQVIEFHPDQTTPETELLAAARGKIREDTWEHLCKRALEIAGEES